MSNLCLICHRPVIDHLLRINGKLYHTPCYMAAIRGGKNSAAKRHGKRLKWGTWGEKILNPKETLTGKGKIVY